MTQSSKSQSNIIDTICAQEPFSALSDVYKNRLFGASKFVKFQAGQTILKDSSLSERIYLIVNGKVRLISSAYQTNDPITLDLRGSGQLVGWVSLLRGSSCEWITASEYTTAISISSEDFISAIKNCPGFANSFYSLPNPQESYYVARHVADSSVYLDDQYFSAFKKLPKQAIVLSVNPNETFLPSPKYSSYNWFLSTSGNDNFPCGSLIQSGQVLPAFENFSLPYRIVGFPPLSDFNISDLDSKNKSFLEENSDSDSDFASTSLEKLGILESESLSDNQSFPFVKGVDQIDRILAVCNMIALHQNVPFRKDILRRLVEDRLRRDKELSLELIGGLCETLGLKSQLASVDLKNIFSLDCPVIAYLNSTPCVVYGFRGNSIIVANPEEGILTLDINELKDLRDGTLKFILARRVGDTPTSRFGWNWFTPLVSKYRKSLLIVFATSLLAQLFGLAIPLLIQQIIDKVLSQGNLSSLNVIGSVMILLALFQGLLMILRTYVFVDTTDRMDLTLGSAVIDRLLGLPLPFFEKRQVGELSQRLGELNSIRSFLTGTALVSVLNIIFASLYLVVMIIYSPLLTAVALSTLPLYLLLTFGVAPIYKFLICKRAVAQARTQSHLIEVLGGIQTVKAQHFELTARWKWQDRYKVFVDNGFKSVALGAAASEIGKFLNQVSSLLVLWIGMLLVLNGDLTLGMLIAFRIISGNVTGPLLQLSGLYQGFQKVQISMERISDIIDQNPELNTTKELDQIPLPPVVGNIRFENVKFRFGTSGPYQVDGVSANILEGQFVGIVGQSGSGKSTLTKLIPRLYDPDHGRIFIDNYDISKVNLSSLRRQIGIVPQDSLLFEGTIAENIALNDPQASTESIIEAAKLACAHDFIMSLSSGYATPLSERGSNLSGGQRQRIAIARTILSNPRLLVMDEATSALDYNTEKQLCSNLQNWAQGRTVLFITHRLPTIRNSDLILVMHEGKLDESGTHTELMNLNQRYSALYKQQSD